MAFIEILTAQCVGCGACVSACPFGAISIQEKKASVSQACTLCGSCVEVCRFDAIRLVRDNKVQGVNLKAYQGIWVFCEQFQGRIKDVSLEILGEGRRLADQSGEQLTAVLLGCGGAGRDDLILYGADRVIEVDDPLLESGHDLRYTDALETLVQTHQPSILLMGATLFGRSLAPRLAARLHTGLTADCTLLEIDPDTGLLLQTRPAFGGNLMATITCPNHRPQMATVRPKVFPMPKKNLLRRGQIMRESVPLPAETGLILQVLDQAAQEAGQNIGEADILIGVGKGIGNLKNIALAEELAHLLGGAVAVSRPLVDSAWYSYPHQVGQTGKTVAPKLYIACGISGAVQHITGVAAQTVVAVNQDPDAPIFKYAHYGIQGDCVNFLQAMISCLRS